MDLGVTNTWLALAAVSLLIIAMAIVAGCIVLARAARVLTDSAARTTAAIDQVAQQLAPLAVRSSAFLDDAHGLVTQLRRADDMATATVGRIADRWRQISALARTGLWPVIAVARAGATVAQWISNRPSSRRDALDEDAEARFADEGGSYDKTATRLDRDRARVALHGRTETDRTGSQARA